MKLRSKYSSGALRGFEAWRLERLVRQFGARGIWVRDQIGDGIIEFWVDAESEIFDFRGLMEYWIFDGLV